jgi:hypothetical protein
VLVCPTIPRSARFVDRDDGAPDRHSRPGTGPADFNAWKKQMSL